MSTAAFSRRRWAETAEGLRRSWMASAVVVVGMGEALEYARPSGTQGGLQRRPVGRRRRAPQLRHPAGTVGEGRLVAWLYEHHDTGPGEDAGHKGYPASCGLDNHLAGLVQLQDAPGVAHLGMQAGEEGLHAAEGEYLPALYRVPLEVFLDPLPVGGDRQLVVAPQRVYQLLQRALRVAQVDLKQACLVKRKETYLFFLRLHEHLHFCMHDLRGRGPQALELLLEAHERRVGG